MLGINIEDVKVTLGLIQGHLIALAVVLVLAVVVTIAAVKLQKPLKGLVRGSAWMAFVVALVIIVDMILTGPLYGIVSMALRGGGNISEGSIQDASALCEDIADEGFVLLKNDGLLPLGEGAKVNTFGWSATNPVYGGTGSGSLSGLYPTVTLLEGIKQAGIEYNEDLTKFYTNWRDKRPNIGMMGQDWTCPEPTIDEYDAAGMFDNAAAYSDTAMIVLSRAGGEGADLPTSLDPNVPDTFKDDGSGTMFAASGLRFSEYPEDLGADKHYLEPTTRELAMIEKVTSQFDKVVVVINASNAMELGWIEDYPSIKSVILAPGPGQTGFNALGNILSGKTNPSGRTVDTFVYDLTAIPAFNNIGEFKYTNLDDVSPESYGQPVTPNFVNYVEGIYVGYRWYETAAAENAIDYDKTVQFPFGYGLSYTTFQQEMGPISESNGTITFDVTVTNTGSTAGKDVVEVYVDPPYTEGGIEKASANLVEFAKTGLLEPGASEKVTISFPVEDMASYDAHGAGCYVLEGGEYVISINSDSHTVLDSQNYNVLSTITYDEGNKRESDQTAAVNQFGYAEGEVTYLSRAGGFANYAEATAAPTNYSMPEDAKAGFYNISNYLTAEATAMDEDPNAEPITTGAKNGLQLKDLRGLDYDDPKWDQLLDQMTLDDMNALISLGGYQTNSVESIGKVRTNDNDGPASINNNFTGVGSVGFPAGVMIAATWSKDLAHDFGSSIGKMADEMNTSGWYAPAMNIHRTAFAGRNFEYYSEDGVLSGFIAANAVAGAKEHGVYSYMKHFALNDQEGNRCDMLCTWSSEQAIREIYLKPFEMCVKDAGCEAVMSSFNYIGNRWAGGTAALCKTVLRDEWGFQGFVETDYFGVYGYMSADQAIRNGTDLMLVAYQTETNNVQFRETNGAQRAMRDAAHNILFVTVNSRAYTDENYAKATATPAWRTILIVVDVIAVVVLAALEFLILKGYKKRQGK